MPKISLPRSILNLKLGGELRGLEAQYATWGDTSKPAIMLFPSMSNSCFAIPHPEHRKKFGRPWWTTILGKGINYGIDLYKYHVVSVSPLGGPFGSTSPITHRPEDNRLWGTDFPAITPADQAAFVQLVLAELGYTHLKAIVGGSMGGMQALEFAAQFPEMYEQCIAIACTAQTAPSTVAFRTIQRNVVRLDRRFADGRYHPTGPPVNGMKVARMFGLICYTSRDKLNEQFDWERLPEGSDHEFEIINYLHYNADKFTTGTAAYDPNCYLTLSKCMDNMNIGDGFESFEEGALRIGEDREVLLLGYDTDLLTPPQDLERLYMVLAGRNPESVYYEELSTQYGHDAFLVERHEENNNLNIRLDEFLTGGVHALHRTHAEMHH